MIFGVNSFEKKPVPSCPKSPAPHVNTFPKELLQIVCLKPQLIETIFSPKEVKESIKQGTFRGFRSPTPNCPSELSLPKE